MTTPRHEERNPAAEEHCRENKDECLAGSFTRPTAACVAPAWPRRQKGRSNLVRNVIGVALRETRVPHQRVD